MDENDTHNLHLEDSARLTSMSPKSDYEKHLEEKRRIMEARKQNAPNRIKEKDSDSFINIRDESLQNKNLSTEPHDIDEETVDSGAIVEISPVLDSDTHLLLADPNSSHSALSDLERKLLLASQFMLKWVEFSSGFLIPMILVKAFPTTLRPTSVYLFFTTLVCSLFSFNVAAWLDQQPRRTVLGVTSLLQAISFFVCTIFFYMIIYYYLNETYPAAIAFVFGTLSPEMVFLCYIITSLAGSIALRTQIAAVEYDWIPTITPILELVHLKNTSNLVATAAEVIGILTTVFFLEVTPLLPAFWVISSLNCVFLAGQYICYRIIFSQRLELSRPQSGTVIQEHVQNPFSLVWREIGNLYHSIGFLIIITHAILSFSLLQPGEMLFIAFLRWWNLSYLSIGTFCAMGSILGSVMIGGKLYQVLTLRIGLFLSPTLFLLIQVVSLLIGASIFQALAQDHLVFVSFVCIGSIGFYGFRLSKMELLEKSDNSAQQRKSVTLVDTAMVQISKITLYAIAMMIANPVEFGVLVWISAGFTLLALVVFCFWCGNKNNRNVLVLS